ncbi:protein prune homolog 2-like [Oratosquilla oratoria]|uniref:protein prune homolog 2-like n=1 Tax=Oratosquilla oratoria TaxID=337810 RepID=UPI003F762EE2
MRVASEGNTVSEVGDGRGDPSSDEVMMEVSEASSNSSNATLGEYSSPLSPDVHTQSPQHFSQQPHHSAQQEQQHIALEEEMNNLHIQQHPEQAAPHSALDMCTASSATTNLNSSATNHVRDPLRFPRPLQNGILVGAALENGSLTAPGPTAQASGTAHHRPLPLSFANLEYCLPDNEEYQPETVDFPSSPTALKCCEDEGVRLAEGEREEPQPTTPLEEDHSMYKAVLSPPTGQVTLRKERPSTLEGTRKKRLTVTDELLNVAVDDDQHSISSLSQHSEDEDAQMLSHDEFTDMLTPDDIDTPDELEESIMERRASALSVVMPHETSPPGLGPQPSVEPMPEYSATQETTEDRSWRAVVISGIERRIDMKVIEPYKKVLSHGGYLKDSHEAIIVFSACFLPDRSRKDYDYVMDSLFLYVLTTLDQLIAEDYVLLYLHGATTRANMPSFAWLKRCYQMIDRRLRKNLKGLYLVHPTFWVKTVVVMTRPFISTKFSRKLRFVASLRELAELIPMDQICIPDRVKQYDEIRESLIKG